MRAVSSLLDPPRDAVVPLSTATVSRGRVLVVDDDRRNLLALSEVLQDIAEIVCAESGEQALRFLLREQFSVIVLDVLMPGLDGYETAKLVRAREQSRATPIIFLTAINKEDAHLLRGYDSGAVDYVFKPFEPIILRSKVSVFVSLHEKSLEIERTGAAQQRLLEEKLHALQALRESEQRQELILSALPIAVYSEEKGTGLPRFVSGNLRAMTGYQAQDFVDDPGLWPGRVHPDDGERVRTGFDGASRSREFRWKHADGSYRVLLDQAVTLADGEGLVAGTIRDITDQRLMQDQLLQAQKMDAIGKLTGGIAHDFNNLLASVLSGLSLLQRRAELNERAMEVVDMTRHAAEHGKHLVSRLLAFSRRQNLTPQVVDLTGVGQSLDAMLTPLLGGLVHLQWDVDAPLWPTFVDPSQLELAIMNLVINARDALPDGGVVTIRLQNRDYAGSDELARGEFVVVTVSDPGTGIPEELLPKVIEPFFTTKDVGKGTGLGLSMAYGFAKQSGGMLTIRSSSGQGTDVEIWLPRSKDRAVEVAGARRTADVTPLVQQHASVLLVDDSQTLRDLTKMQLTEEGYSVTSASSGTEALAMIDGEPERFDVLLTDFAMPVMSGVELVNAARRRRPDWPAVIITGYAQTEAIAGRPAGVPIVSKPFTTAILVEAIEGVLRVGSSQERPATAERPGP
jgi:signal transduction histidine kinase